MNCRLHASVALTSALAACDSCPPDYHVIHAMRVLGTTYDPPVATPGGVVTVRALTADVEDRDVTVAWYRCPRPFQLTSVAAVDGGLDVAGQAAPCLAQGEFARGLSVRVPIDVSGGALDALPYRTRRRWTDLVGFACADGSIEAPPVGGTWPRCTGTRGVVFTVSIPGPMADGTSAAPAPATIVGMTFGEGRTPWPEGAAPVTPRCEGSRETCPSVPISFSVADSMIAVEVTGAGTGILGAPDDSLAFVGYHVTGMAPVSTEFCAAIDSQARLDANGARLTLRWVPPAETGDVTFWFTARRFSGGLTVARRSVRVQ